MLQLKIGELRCGDVIQYVNSPDLLYFIVKIQPYNGIEMLIIDYIHNGNLSWRRCSKYETWHNWEYIIRG